MMDMEHFVTFSLCTYNKTIHISYWKLMFDVKHLGRRSEQWLFRSIVMNSERIIFLQILEKQKKSSTRQTKKFLPLNSME